MAATTVTSTMAAKREQARVPPLLTSARGGSASRGSATFSRVAILISGERRTFDQVRESLRQNFLRALAAQAFLFDCSEGSPPLSFPGSLVTGRLSENHTRDWHWSSSLQSQVLIQFERNHRCWQRAAAFEASQPAPFSAVVKMRPDLFIKQPIDLLALLSAHRRQRLAASAAPAASAGGAASSRRVLGVLLARARCWPAGRLPRSSWTYGHTRCGDQPLADDAFFVVPWRESAEAVFSRFDDNLMNPPFPRCNTSFKAAVVAECVFSLHLRRHGVEFVPTSFDIAIARADDTSSTGIRIEGMSSGAQPGRALRHSPPSPPPPPPPPPPPSLVPRLVVCSASDRKGVCRVTEAFARQLLGAFLRERCQPTLGGAARQRPVHVMLGCDNAPALDFAEALSASAGCKRRFDAHARAHHLVYPAGRQSLATPPRSAATTADPAAAADQPVPDRAAAGQPEADQLALMILKEPRAVSERFYSRGSLSERFLERLPQRSRNSTATLLLIDAFGSTAPSPLHAASSSRDLNSHGRGRSNGPHAIAIPWAAVSYASRNRKPTDLYLPALGSGEGGGKGGRGEGSGKGQSGGKSSGGDGGGGGGGGDGGDGGDGGEGRFCAFMGHRKDPWGLDDTALRAIAPGYLIRDALIRLLGCTHLQPGDRNAVSWRRPPISTASAATSSESAPAAGLAADLAASEGADDGPTQTGPFETTLRHYAGYRFVLAVENTDAGSPISEKMINAYLSNAIPISWGGGSHRHVFNPASFVDCTSLAGGAAACASLVRAIDANVSRREAMRRAPRFATRRAFERFFAWADGGDASGTAAQRRLHDQLFERLGARLGCSNSDLTL